MIVLLLVCLARYTQSAEKNNYAISLQYRQINVKDEVGFFPADKRWRFIQIDNIILDVCGQASKNYPSLAFPYNIVKTKWVIMLIFFHTGSHASLQQIDTMILMKMVKHFQIYQNSTFAVFLQYLKKEVRNEVSFFTSRYTS